MHDVRPTLGQFLGRVHWGSITDNLSAPPVGSLDTSSKIHDWSALSRLAQKINNKGYFLSRRTDQRLESHSFDSKSPVNKGRIYIIHVSTNNSHYYTLKERPGIQDAVCYRIGSCAPSLK